MSLRRPTVFPRACSGLMYAAVPKITPIWVMAGVVMVGDLDASAEVPAGSIAFANPKSKTFTVPSGLTLMFAGFRSRWMIPCSWAASSASAIWLRDGQRLIERNRPARNPLGKRRSLDEFHYERADTVGFFETVDLRDVGMIQRGEDLALRAETVPGGRGRLRETIGRTLDGDVTIQLRIASPDTPHPYPRPQGRKGFRTGQGVRRG